MTATTMTANDRRIADVAGAQRALPDAYSHAITITAVYGVDSPEARQAWAEVEGIGAVIHRRARLLAGKPRGG